MKVTIAMDNFPMLLLDMLVADMARHLNNIDIQVGGEDTVYVSFFTEDIVKVQTIAILCDKYRFGKNLAPLSEE